MTEIGVGGILALLIIREVLTFLKTRKMSSRPNTAGDLSPDYWQGEQRKAMTEVILTIVVPILTNQTTILAELRNSYTEMSRSIAVILDRSKP